MSKPHARMLVAGIGLNITSYRLKGKKKYLIGTQYIYIYRYRYFKITTVDCNKGDNIYH